MTPVIRTKQYQYHSDNSNKRLAMWLNEFQTKKNQTIFKTDRDYPGP